MLSAEISPFPGAREVAGLRTRARSARRTALIALSGSIALLASAQMLAERAPTREETLPLAVLALLVFLGALPVLAVTQAAWGVRVRRVRRREQELYAAAGEPPLARVLSRLGVAACWTVTLLLGCTVPRLFRESGLYGAADAMGAAVEVLSLAGYVAAVFFSAWWARGALALLPSRAGARAGVPGDPWDPGRRAPRRRVTALWSGTAVAVAALLGARAHLWEPATAVLYALLAAALVCGVVTDE